MPQLYEPNYLEQHDIAFHEIVFLRDPEADFVTLFGAFDLQAADEPKERDFGCDFSMLTDLLLLAGADGELLITHLSDMLSDLSLPATEPVGLDVTALLGRPLHLKDISIRVYKPKEQNRQGAWVEMQDEYYLIDEIKPLPPPNHALEELQVAFAMQLSALRASYGRYRQLREWSISKKKARRMTGLKDKRLFRLAKIQYLLHQIPGG